ncbi:dienelactone hydrolase family protein [Polyangium jinanense]|uniref:alpha/beta hydrolase n=1 Tax=Polyangium jinanense TaxID=2829994 RepID=UPI00233F9BD8|nr:dienelactone hydrolase family protein [Polyangium jinanense]MDC3962385.1 dienelactone hydrolase family protein [Polyangium jinanense]
MSTKNRRTTVILRALCCCLALASFACASRPRASPTPARAEGTLAGYHYLTFVTGGARSTDALPLIVGLHYSSATPETIRADFDQIDIPARIVLPRGKYPRRSGYSWFPSSYGELAADKQAKLTFEVKDEVLAFVEAAAHHDPTTGKPVLVGTSYGGDLSYLIAIHHPDRVAAVFPIAARFPAEWLPATSTCRPSCPLVYAMHGEKDAVVPIDGARRAAQQLTELGHRVELHEYAGIAHDFSAQMKSDFTAQLRAVLSAAR